MPVETRTTMSKAKSSSKLTPGDVCSCNLSEVLAEIKASRNDSADLKKELKQDSVEIKKAIDDLRISIEFTQSEVDMLKQVASFIKFKKGK